MARSLNLLFCNFDSIFTSMKKIVLFLVAIATASIAIAQLPQTEIWVFDLKQDATGYSISNPKKVIAGNGYNNQPYFTQDGEEMYFTSNGKKRKKTDIYKYNFKKKRNKITRITKTNNESEYSPKLTPGGTKISCVRVAKDTTTQNMCTYNLQGKQAEILFPKIKTFGYYCWKSQIDLLAFHVPEPFQFIKHNFPYKKHDTLASNIGRCIVNNKGKILYVDKSDSNKWTINILNNRKFANRSFTSIKPDQVLTETVQDAEDFALIRGKDIVMAKDGFVYIKRKIFSLPNANWEPVFNLNRYKLYEVYRIVVAPNANRLAVVRKVDNEE